MTEPTDDLAAAVEANSLDAWLARARRLQPFSPEIAPGVTWAEAEAAAAHAIAVQGGFSTPAIEAERLSADRADRARERARQQMIEVGESVVAGRPSPNRMGFAEMDAESESEQSEDRGMTKDDEIVLGRILARFLAERYADAFLVKPWTKPASDPPLLALDGRIDVSPYERQVLLRLGASGG